MRQIKRIIIHYSATDSGLYNHDAITNDHRVNRGFRDIGYHYTIDKSGNIRIGREIELAGAHTLGENYDSIGICLLGKQNFTKEQFTATRNLLKILLRAFKGCTIHTHSEYSNTPCPNFSLKEIL